MNNKGFTLIELLAVIVLLAIVLTIGGITVNTYITSSKQKSYEILVENIKIAAQNYYEECRYAKTGNIECNWEIAKSIVDGNEFPLSRLKQYGFLTTEDKNSEMENGAITSYVITNPLNKKEIQDCNISIEYKDDDPDDGIEKKEYVVTSTSDDCPTTDQYAGTFNW